MAQIWIVQPGTTVTIRLVFAGVATGQFGLSAVSLHGGATNLTQVGAPGPAGQAVYTISPTDNLGFSMSAACTTSPTGSGDAMVEVSQNGVIAPCVDAGGRIRNGGGGGYHAMKMGSVAAGTAKVFNFQVLR